MAEVSIQQISEAIGRYYENLSQPYDDQFSIYCDDNGIDEDGLQDELNENPNDCILAEFDDDFPFKGNVSENEKNRIIVELIRKCKQNPEITFGSSIPKFRELGAKLFQGLDLNNICEIYKRQCPVLWSGEWDGDQGLLMVLAVGKKHGFEYLMHLVDDFGRYRIQSITDSVANWSRSHKHFKQMQTVSVDVVKHNKIKRISYQELATCAVSSFSKRVCGSLQLKNMQSIDDSLEDAVEYIANAITFVSNLITNATKLKSAICPFQIDFAIASGQPIIDEMTEGIDEDDDDDDDDDDTDYASVNVKQTKEPKGYVDCVDKVEIKLKDHSLKYTLGIPGGTKDDEKESTKGDARMFENIYKNLLNEHKLVGKSEGFEYLHKKRLIALIDRRDKKKNEEKQNDIWMYEPPSDCHNMPHDNVVPEWYIDSSLSCILPSRTSKEDKKAESKEDKNKEEKDKLRRANIGAKDHCKGGLLTLSFHVKQENMMKCYLYWNGGIIRFLPDDIKTVLPTIFNMKYQGNEAYIKDENKELEQLIKEMKGKLVDEEFQQFVSSYNY